MKAVKDDSNFQKLVRKITRFETGSVFLSDDLEIEDKAVLRVYLARMVESNFISRLAPGVFYLPRYSSVLKSTVPPDIDRVAEAIAKSERARIIPVGNYALYKAGLTTQVPSVAVFGTDGTARVIKLNDGRTIKFKAAAARNFAYNSPVVQTVVSAMREIGEKNITEDEVSRVKKLCSSVNKETLESDLRLAPEWISKALKRGVEYAD